MFQIIIFFSLYMEMAIPSIDVAPCECECQRESSSIVGRANGYKTALVEPPPAIRERRVVDDARIEGQVRKRYDTVLIGYYDYHLMTLSLHVSSVSNVKRES